jgi:hypothetical protein
MSIPQEMRRKAELDGQDAHLTRGRRKAESEPFFIAHFVLMISRLHLSHAGLIVFDFADQYQRCDTDK